MGRISKIFWGMLGAALIAGAADACERGPAPQGVRSAIDAGNLNQGLIDAAILRETNYQRCRNGRRPLSAAGTGLVKQAYTHSTYMAKRGALVHENPIRGSRNAQERVKSAGVRAKSGSENIGMVYRFRIDGLNFKIVNASRCSFATWGGEPLGPHSYETLAQAIVAFWAASPEHAKNLFNGRYTHVGSGAAFEPAGPHCGRIWVTQTLYRQR